MTGTEMITRMEHSVQKVFFGLEPGETDTVYLVSAFHEPFVVAKHRIGERSIICPGKDQCPSCKQGERPEEFFCYTVFSEKYGRQIASWRFTKKGVLKRFHKRFKTLNPDGTASDAIKSMRGDTFTIERESGGFGYDVAFVDNRLDQVEGMQEYTPAEILAKMKGQGND